MPTIISSTNLITMHDTGTDFESTSIKKVINMRDLSQYSENKIPAGLIYRSGTVSTASKEDAEIITERLKIKTLIDLRCNTEVRFTTNIRHFQYT